jgi:hypothetical protein
MQETQTSSLLKLLTNRIDVTQVPFSDRGSRLLVYQVPGRSRLLIKLAERLTGLQPGLDTYRRRQPFIHSFSLVDEAGEELDFEEVVTTPHALCFRTRLGDFHLVFQDEHVLSLGLPNRTTAGIRFRVSPQFWEETESGGVFKSVRNLAYASDGKCARNEITPKGGGYIVEFVIESGSDCAITLAIGGSPDLSQPVLPFSAAYGAAEERWRNWFDRVPSVAERYRPTYAYAWWIMASNLISPHGSVIYEAMTPSKMNYVGLWLWDSALHALAYRHVDPELARDQIRAMIAHQLSDGMLPDAVYDEGIVAEIDHPIRAEVTKPPILAWAALKLHETDPNLDFLKEIYVPLVRWNAWWFSMNDDDVDGLAQYNHPYSSGLDDSPLWDYGMPVESPDLNTYLCVQMGSLAMIAEALGMDAEGAMWRRRAAAIVKRMISDFWDDEAGLFRALHNEEPIPVVTPFNLYPLWTGQLPVEMNDRLIGHLTDPEEFWDDYIIPTVARNDGHYDPAAMWRGPVWANINYFFIEALHQVGRDDLACILRDKTLQLVMDHPSIYEYYNSETGERPKGAADIFGWTAAAFIDLAIQASQEEEG